ncbi:hypothetical protein BC941DRAFT_512395 [Chlamydoabsidia padenii]|nr:hypothetical protein BC941DRAFT_512395 [Chlamydoabsidia padenii]
MIQLRCLSTDKKTQFPGFFIFSFFFPFYPTLYYILIRLFILNLIMSGPAGSNHPKIHQRKISLTTACPPTSARQDRRNLSHSTSSSLLWCQRLWASRVVRWVAYVYVLFSMLFCASQVLSSGANPTTHSDNYLSVKATNKQTTQTPLPPTLSLPLSKLNNLNTQLRLSKMFSKSLQQPDNVRPFWFTASGPATHICITTVMTLDDMDSLERMAIHWKGSISAVIQIETKNGLNSGLAVQALSRLRREYETRPSLGKYVDMHLILLPPQSTRIRLQAARNMARLFSRSHYIMHTPIKTLWLPSFDSVLPPASTLQGAPLIDLLDQGNALVVPTFAFPRRANVQTDVYPDDRDGIIEWVDSGRMGLLDHHWSLNAGPTSYNEWREATEPYLVTEYDYHYGPVYITTKEHHPWCEERFDDQLPACVYTTFLNGADFYVLHDAFIIRSGQEPENELNEAERLIQDGMYKNYRIEQCAFYARQFDQQGVYETERAIHVKQECIKALRKENIVKI